MAFSCHCRLLCISGINWPYHQCEEMLVLYESHFMGQWEKRSQSDNLKLRFSCPMKLASLYPDMCDTSCCGTIAC